jgi:hypothetical protein
MADETDDEDALELLAGMSIDVTTVRRNVRLSYKDQAIGTGATLADAIHDVICRPANGDFVEEYGAALHLACALAIDPDQTLDIAEQLLDDDDDGDGDGEREAAPEKRPGLRIIR